MYLDPGELLNLLSCDAMATSRQASRTVTRCLTAMCGSEWISFSVGCTDFRWLSLVWLVVTLFEWQHWANPSIHIEHRIRISDPYAWFACLWPAITRFDGLEKLKKSKDQDGTACRANQCDLFCPPAELNKPSNSTRLRNISYILFPTQKSWRWIRCEAQECLRNRTHWCIIPTAKLINGTTQKTWYSYAGFTQRQWLKTTERPRWHSKDSTLTRVD